MPQSPPKTPKSKKTLLPSQQQQASTAIAPRLRVVEPSPARSIRSEMDGSIDSSIMIHKGEAFKRQLNDDDELDDFAELEQQFEASNTEWYQVNGHTEVQLVCCHFSMICR